MYVRESSRKTIERERISENVHVVKRNRQKQRRIIYLAKTNSNQHPVGRPSRPKGMFVIAIDNV